MTRLDAVLVVVLVVSAFALIRVSHESRRLFGELDRARNEQRLLDNEFQRLRSEQQSQATPLRVEKAARERLGMRVAGPAVTQYIDRTPPVAATGSPR